MNLIIKESSLTPYQYAILIEKKTDPPFSSSDKISAKVGTYLCRLCGLGLFQESAYFSSGCGWPSFDDALQDHVLELPDPDGRRTEIVCTRCKGHLGHVFRGEGFTKKNQRYCVNATSLDFCPEQILQDSEEIILAAGCFWGVEALLQKEKGIALTECGYIGGKALSPTYREVCTGKTGHLEAVRVIFDPAQTSTLNVLKAFFEIHDFTQKDGQGPDIGEQYQSAIFTYTAKQQAAAQKLIQELQKQGYEVATTLRQVSPFWPAEEGHQNYYQKHKKAPYCHMKRKLFD